MCLFEDVILIIFDYFYNFFDFLFEDMFIGLFYFYF